MGVVEPCKDCMVPAPISVDQDTSYCIMVSMTRKDYEVLARYISMIENPAVRQVAAKTVACACESENGRFDRERFMTAAGVVTVTPEPPARPAVMFIRPGDRVRFNDRVTPAYLRGFSGEIFKINRKTVTVGLAKGAQEYRVPFTAIEKA